jgi:hypothetical protein
MQVETDEPEVIVRVAALDVGQADGVCCVRVPAGPGGQRMQQVRTTSTMTATLLALGDWLAGLGVSDPGGDGGETDPLAMGPACREGVSFRPPLTPTRSSFSPRGTISTSIDLARRGSRQGPLHGEHDQHGIDPRCAAPGTQPLEGQSVEPASAARAVARVIRKGRARRQRNPGHRRAPTRASLERSCECLRAVLSRRAHQVSRCRGEYCGAATHNPSR